MTVGKRRMITLKQVRDQKQEPPVELNKLHSIEEGEQYGVFKVAEIREITCEHPNRRWRVNKQVSSEAPNIVGACKICGHKKEVQPDER